MSNTNKILSWLARIWERIFGPLMELSVWLTYCLFNYSNIFGAFCFSWTFEFGPALSSNFRLRENERARSLCISTAHRSTAKAQHEHIQKQNQTKSNHIGRWYWYRFLVDGPTNEDLVSYRVFVYVYVLDSSSFIKQIYLLERETEKEWTWKIWDDSQFGTYGCIWDWSRVKENGTRDRAREQECVLCTMDTGKRQRWGIKWL